MMGSNESSPRSGGLFTHANFGKPFFWAAAAALIAACGESGDGGGGAGDGVALAELPPRLVEAQCAALEACFGDQLSLFLPGEDCPSFTRPAAEDEVERLRPAVEEGRVRYDGAKIGACLDEIERSGCSALTERFTETCGGAVEGTVELGGDCQADEECAGAAYCKADSGCPGRCARLETAGGNCSRNEQCESGLICSDLGRCTAPAGPGEDCGGDGGPPCRPDLACVGEDEAGNPGMCRSLDQAFGAGAGEPCDLLEQRLCRAGLVCTIESFDSMGNITATCQEPVASGAACRVSFPDPCPSDEHCVVSGQTLDGTCMPRPTEGEPCAVSSLDSDTGLCAPGLRCDDGVCRALQRLGGSCSVDDVCYSEHCRDGLCASPATCG